MSSYLWKYYLEDDVDRFRHLLETATYHVRAPAQRGAGGGQNVNTQMSSSPATHGGSSPLLGAKGKRTPARDINTPGSGQNAVSLTRADINWRDAQGLTILHHAASSVSEIATAFAQALLDHPLLDLYLQDLESGWTALHRAFYFGNISIARAILERDSQNAFGRALSGKSHHVLGLIKIKDHEGHGPLDLYAATIQDRTLHPETAMRGRSDSVSSDTDMPTGDNEEVPRRNLLMSFKGTLGDECFTFGSNRNITLGFGDEDDRQWPERITLRRPPHLLQRFYREHMATTAQSPVMGDSIHVEHHSSTTKNHVPVESMPWVVQSRPIKIEDVFMSKLHTAVLTDDPESNLHVCGHGPGGRLGLGHEKSQFTFACVEGGGLSGKKIVAVGLGLNHTLAVSDDGEIFTWGSNMFGQLGYSLPKSGLKDEDPVQTLPRQIFGPLKREMIQGVAASRIHSVAYTGSSLYTWGKNEGQLGLVDSDARSLEVQLTPRKVGASLFSTSIASVSAIDRATICLLSGSHDCWVFANYGYAKVQFPTSTFQNYFLNEQLWSTRTDSWQNHVVKITSGGDSICAMSSNGEVYSLSVSQPQGGQATTASTTNPGKIKASLSQPQRIWSLKKNNMAARDVGVDADGSIIITTDEGSVWKRSRRAKIKDATASGTADYKPKDYKFSRVSGLTRVVGVRASSYGAYAAIRRDCDVTKTQIAVEPSGLWRELWPLLSFKDFQTTAMTPDSESETPEHRFWQGRKTDETALLKKHLLESKDLESELKQYLYRITDPAEDGYDLILTSSVSDLSIPVHQAVLAARSRLLRDKLPLLSSGSDTEDLDFMKLDSTKSVPIITFVGLDPFTLVDFVLYLYTDNIIDYWHYASRTPKMAHRYRTIRTELMKVAGALGLKKLEASVRQMISPTKSMDEDFETAFRDPVYFDNADILVELAEDEEIPVHSAIVCRRCPFFEGMFMGRAGGRWLEGRRSADKSDLVKVDLKHIDPSIFQIVLRHIYADSGEELFDNVVSTDLEDFFDTIMEVLSVANELMLDRLAQICQKVMGQYVNVRNVASLLNAVAPSSVSEFKDATLEYMCLSLESMLHGGLLDELDEDLLYELDETVRANQLACLPWAKSGRAEALLLDNHPELVEIMERNRRAKIDSIAIHNKHSDIDNWASNSYRVHSFDADHASPTQQKSRRRSKGGQSSRQSPAIKGKEAVEKLGSTYDEAIDLDLDLGAPALAGDRDGERAKSRDTFVGSPPQDVWFDSRGKVLSPPAASPSFGPSPGARSPNLKPTSAPLDASGAPWASSPSAVRKLDMKDIMAQTSSSRISSLSAEIAASKVKDGQPAAPAVNKMSQKERKKLQQQQAAAQLQAQKQAIIEEDAAPTRRGTPPPKASPWQTVGSSTKITSLRDVMHGEAKPSTSPAQSKPSTSRQPSTPQLTMRQTVANTKSATSTSVPKTPAVMANPSTKTPTSSASRPAPIKSATAPTSSVRSIRHQPRPVEPSVQLSMADILNQQQTEKDIIAKVKEDNAKRSLQDIQAEQEFQEWWDAEERRLKIEAGLLPTDEEDEETSPNTKAPSKRGGKPGRGRGRGKEGCERRSSSKQVREGGDKPAQGGDRNAGRERSSRGRGRGGGVHRGRGGHGEHNAAGAV
ncbi:Regulator of chromosome condensation (RCC1) repeat-containing protein 3 [Elsinoe fawcettii]|nr:Regulator of chromosome condensation (RCC1) repeat-containing protein 3 [Elsinoe fawcettii]